MSVAKSKISSRQQMAWDPVQVHDVFNLFIIGLLNVENIYYLATGSGFTAFYTSSMVYFLLDTVFVGLYPQSVKSPLVILVHHMITALYILIPYNYPQYHWCMSYCMLVEVNTWLLIAKRVLGWKVGGWVCSQMHEVTCMQQSHAFCMVPIMHGCMPVHSVCHGVVMHLTASLLSCGHCPFCLLCVMMWVPNVGLSAKHDGAHCILWYLCVTTCLYLPHPTHHSAGPALLSSHFSQPGLGEALLCHLGGHAQHLLPLPHLRLLQGVACGDVCVWQPMEPHPGVPHHAAAAVRPQLLLDG